MKHFWRRNRTPLLAFLLVAALGVPLSGAFIDYSGMNAPQAVKSLIVCGTTKGCTGPEITRISSTVLGIPGARFTDLDLGLSGTAGSLDVFPTTASKGKLRITAADSSGDTTTSIVNASQSGARTYTIPDAGASASFVMTEGAQTVNGTKTIPAIVTTDIDAGASGTAGTVDVFPTTASKGKIAIVATANTGNTTTTITNAAQAGAVTYTIPDAGASASFVMSEGTQTVNGAKTFGSTITYSGAVVRTSYSVQAGFGGAKAGATAGWVTTGATNLGEWTLPASQTNSTLVIPIVGLHLGDTITGYTCHAQIESAGGAVTLDTNLRSLTNAAADPTDASVGSTTQVSVSADTAAAPTVGSLSDTVAAGERFYVLVTSTTAGSTDIRFLGCTITLTTS